MSNRTRRHVQLYQAILDLNPIAYWVLDEKEGTTAYDWVTARTDGARNGTYSSDVSTWPIEAGCGDGRSAPQFDGINDYIDVFSATSAINTGVGSVIWIAQNDDWSAATREDMFVLSVAGYTSYIHARKNAANNVRFEYMAGSVLSSVVDASYSPDEFEMYAISWDKAGNEFKAFVNGAQVGTTQVIGGTWAGAFDSSLCAIGATSTAPINPWNGSICHFSLLTSALSSNVFSAIYDVWQGQ